MDEDCSFLHPPRWSFVLLGLLLQALVLGLFPPVVFTLELFVMDRLTKEAPTT